jgi:formylglycine-generating enzyme required for sulfatase activity
MPAKLPNDLITRVKPLLIPYLRDKDEREALFIETYFLRDPRVLEQVNFEGSPDVFAIRCIADLVGKIGCLAEEGETGEREHSLAALLSTIRARCGVEKHAEIDHWRPILDDQCQTPPPSQPAAPVPNVAQTTTTPPDERKPSVFISYSHANAVFAKQLIDSLTAAGHPCWIDASEIKGGADWQRAICDGINLSYTLVVICTHKALESEYVWDEIQWARTRHKLIIPILLEDVTADDRFFGMHRFQGIRFDLKPYETALADLLTALPAPTSGSAPPRPLTRREHELAYLDRLRFDDFRLEKFEMGEYAPLGGTAQTRQAARDEWQALAMRQEFAVIRGQREAEEVDSAPEGFTDAVQKITELRRVVVLGEPGAGKTHTLRALAKPLYTAALSDPTAPIPLLIKLGNWDEPGVPFEAFFRDTLGELGAHLEELFASQRAVLLLDGLNEFPADQRSDKYPQVEAFIKAHPQVMAVVTCRQADYPISLHLNRVLIRPLDPLRIRDFARRVLHDEAKGDPFFWKLAGGAALQAVWHKWEKAGADFALFWTAPDVPRENPNVYGSTSGGDDSLWREQVRSASSLMGLASNPYMLRMLLDVYMQYGGALPDNRGQLFERFVNVLLKREKLADIDEHTQGATLTAEGQALLTGLRQVAFEMQVRRAAQDKDADASAGTSLDTTAVRAILNDRLLYLAVSTSILNSGQEVRFSHQLLQEYFAARHMDSEMRAGRLKAADIWKPGQWWERTNWEEAVVLLAGLYSDDCTPVLNWLEEANPEVAALCAVRSGAKTTEATQAALRDKWLKRLSEPNPKARAAVGRALGLPGWDTRPGVGLRADGLPDIEWCEVNDSQEWTYQDEKRPALPPYRIAKYPITYRQFQAFMEAADGWNDPRWWEGLSDNEYRRANQSAPGDQTFKVWNHPRERVSWYDAIAFCRWLSHKLGSNYALDKVDEWAVRLPTEFEWERAARGTDGRVYPYGDTFDAAKGNTDETGIGQTSAVGIFPDGVSPAGALDMSGNVWEWCLTDYRNPAANAAGEVLSSDSARVVRGGSWLNNQVIARAASRLNYDPNDRDVTSIPVFGFLRVSPSPESLAAGGAVRRQPQARSASPSCLFCASREAESKI